MTDLMEKLKHMKFVVIKGDKTEEAYRSGWNGAIECVIENVSSSADADGEDLIIKGAKGIQDGLYNIKDGKLFKYKAKGGTVRTYPIVPSADAVQGEWNTGKPTKRGKYIVTLIGIGDYRFVDIMHYDKPCMPNIEVSGACWYCDDDEWGDVVYDDTDILAWMPLPKPYREDGE